MGKKAPLSMCRRQGGFFSQAGYFGEEKFLVSAKNGTMIFQSSIQ
jgi:hypothetical protein